MREAIEFLQDPPLGRAGFLVIGYFNAAATTVEPQLQETLGLTPSRFYLQAGKGLVRALRWALRFSPSWKAALNRSGAEFDPKLFAMMFNLWVIGAKASKWRTLFR